MRPGNVEGRLTEGLINLFNRDIVYLCSQFRVSNILKQMIMQIKKPASNQDTGLRGHYLFYRPRLRGWHICQRGGVSGRQRTCGSRWIAC